METTNASSRIMNARERIDAYGWVFFLDSYYTGVFKARPDGSELTQISKEKCNEFFLSKIDNLVHFHVITDEYSRFNEDAYEYDRYQDTASYKIMPDGEVVEIEKSTGYMGSSN
jgi:hypothetical protein